MTDEESDFPDNLTLEPVSCGPTMWVPYYISNERGTMLTYVPFEYMEENVLHSEDDDENDYRIK